MFRFSISIVAEKVFILGHPISTCLLTKTLITVYKRIINLYFLVSALSNCNARLRPPQTRSKKCQTNAQRGKCPYCIYYMNTKQKQRERNETVLNGDIQNTEQKINTHETQVGKGYLSMILNQRQLTTPASD